MEEISKLTITDPFADVEDTTIEEGVPFEEPAAPVKKAAPKKAAPKQPSDREGVTVTLKGGSGFDAPWIVIHASDLEDAYDQVSGENASLLAKLMEKTAAAGKHFSGFGGGKDAPRSAPQAAAEAPAGTPEAPGPDWVYKTGVNAKTGKPWKAWMPPRGSDAKPVWL